jgi:hypothetical protein
VKLESSWNWRNLLVLFIIFLAIFETLVYVLTTPKPQEQFFQLYLLGANHMASDYYPNNDSDIRPGTFVRWYLGVTNSMGNVQLVILRVKLANQNIAAPDDLRAIPSPAPLVTEFDRFIQNNETWEMPFIWRISNATAAQGSTRILELEINNETYVPQDLSTVNGFKFRLIFELWTWNMQSAELQFGWFAGTEHRVAWLQVWFNVTAPPKLMMTRMADVVIAAEEKSALLRLCYYCYYQCTFTKGLSSTARTMERIEPKKTDSRGGNEYHDKVESETRTTRHETMDSNSASDRTGGSVSLLSLHAES